MSKINFPALLSFACGFISLSLEILWVRLYGFSLMSTPAAFGFVLMAFLVGVALGAKQGGKLCKGDIPDAVLWQKSILALLVSSVFTLVLPIFFAWEHSQWWRNPLFDFVLIALVSGTLAYVFPLAHHLGASGQKTGQGQRFAWVYSANVMGAAIGPLVTGYILLNLLSLQQVFMLFAATQLAVVFVFYHKAKSWPWRLPISGSFAGVVIVLLAVISNFSAHELIQKVSSNGQAAHTIIENKYGIITLFAPDDLEKYQAGDDAVFGGNVYDGRTNVSMQNNSNGLDRLLLLAALQPEPKRVLMVGLSIGSWLALVEGFPNIEHIDVVEINAGYLEAAQAYQAQANALKNPKVNIVIDDARRWLTRHPDQQYDLIIMNTTWHWRANSSFLLSAEFLQIIKNHMNPGAVMTFNTTGSADAFYTASTVFEHAYRYSNFVYAAQFDFRERKDHNDAKQIWQSLEVDGTPLFTANDPLIEKYLNGSFIPIELVQKVAERPLEVITDNNAITEFKYGLPLMRLYLH